MKKVLFLGLCFSAFCASSYAEDHHHEKSYKFSIHQKDYRFCTDFEMDTHGKPFGLARKSVMRWLKPVRNTYDIYNADGDYQGVGIGHIACLGFFKRWSWGAEFTVWDKTGAKVGVIDGQFWSTEPARFKISNAKGDCIAYAYLDRSDAGFTIVHPQKDTHIYGRFTRNFVQDQIDSWDAVVYDPDAVDELIVKVFAAFAVDTQEYFKADK
jgi:hypothetical protein